MADLREQRIRISDPAVLSRYLPDNVVHYLLEDSVPPDIDLGQHVARLQELLQVIVTYVPEFANVHRRTLPAARPGSLSRAQGTILAADLSGFTAFSARLSTLGSEGAEIVARTISALFSALLDALAGWDGSLLKLSGDALTALFSGPDHARRAAAAAIELQRRMAAFQSLVTPAGTFMLRMRIGLASGEVLLAQVGVPERVELLVAGAAARRVMEFQRHAPPGAVVVGGAAYREIAGVCRAVALAADLYQLLDVDPGQPPAPPAAPVWVPRRDPAWELHALIARIEALRPYLIDQHLSRIAGGPAALAGEGDLRPVTVLFANLADAGPLLEASAPGQEQAALEQIQASVRRLWQIVERHGGTVNKLDLHPAGHTLIALFGAPVAQGRDAERAVSCAQALLRAFVAPGQDELAPLRVRRVGMATGRVFAGAVGSAERREYTVMGAVVNLAARLMENAGEGQALLDLATAQVIRRRFPLHGQPPMLIKGYEQPVPFYALAVEQRTRVSSLTRVQEPMVNRSAELAAARRLVIRALGGEGGGVALVGEPGIGKSRLLAEVVRSALTTPATDTALVVAQAQPHSQMQPYGMIADIFRQLYGLPERLEEATVRLAEQVAQLTPDHERFLPLLPTIFALPAEESPITQALTPDERRARLHALAADLLAAHARSSATALVLEDLHWADAPSLEILGDLAAAARDLPLLILYTCRPESLPAWPGASLTPIEIPALPPDHSQTLISHLLGPLALPERLRAAVVERTQGNPFFIEETVRALRERGLAGDSEPPLPATVQGALLARLDRLPIDERYILQIASAVGAQFGRALLADISGERVALDAVLDRLIDRGLVRQIDEDRYTFTHSLTQETIYQNLLFAQRRDIHRTIAAWLRADPEREDAEPGLLAFHYRRAEEWPDALEYAWRAGLRAQALYAGDVALEHFQRALEAADHIGPTAAQRRPAILRRIGDLHALAGRYGDANTAYAAALVASNDVRERADVRICWSEVCEQQADYDEALSLLDQAAAGLPGGGPLALRIGVRRGWVLIRRGDAEAARAAVEPRIEQLEAQQLWGDLLLAYKVFFHIAATAARWSEARSYLRLALACAEQTSDIREIARLHNNMGIVLTQEGNLREAARECEQAVVVMKEIGDQNTLASIEVNIGGIYYKIGDFDMAINRYNASLQIATHIGAPPIESIARSNLGEVYRRLGRLPESLGQLLRSVEICRQTNDEAGLSEAYRQLAETYMALDRLGEADETCERARETAIAAIDPQLEAIAYRVRAMLALKRGDYEAALEDARRSVAMLADLGSTHETGQSMVVLATILFYDARPDAATDVLKEAVQLLENAGAAADRAQALQLLQQIQTQAKEAP